MNQYIAIYVNAHSKKRTDVNILKEIENQKEKAYLNTFKDNSFIKQLEKARKKAQNGTEKQ